MIKVLHAENATYPWYPASVTKLMTAYTTLRAIKEDDQKILDLVFVSDARLWTVSANHMARQWIVGN